MLVCGRLLILTGWCCGMLSGRKKTPAHQHTHRHGCFTFTRNYLRSVYLHTYLSILYWHWPLYPCEIVCFFSAILICFFFAVFLCVSLFVSILCFPSLFCTSLSAFFVCVCFFLRYYFVSFCVSFQHFLIV